MENIPYLYGSLLVYKACVVCFTYVFVRMSCRVRAVCDLMGCCGVVSSGDQSVNSMKRAGGLWESVDLSFRENNCARHPDKIWQDVWS